MDSLIDELENNGKFVFAETERNSGLIRLKKMFKEHFKKMFFLEILNQTSFRDYINRIEDANEIYDFARLAKEAGWSAKDYENNLKKSGIKNIDNMLTLKIKKNFR